MTDSGARQATNERETSGPGASQRSWIAGLRWFAAEFLVVVSGVLVALALNAYYQGRVDAGREAGYLQQLAADLAESEVKLEAALTANRGERDKVMRLLRLFGDDEVPSSEEFAELKALSFKSADPTLSTAQAIVETGDLHLITDDALRSKIIHYVSAGEAYLDVQNALSWAWLTPGIRDYFAMVRPGVGPGHKFAVSPAEALSLVELFDLAFDLQLGYGNFIRFQEGMLEDVRSTLREVERVVAGS